MTNGNIRTKIAQEIAEYIKQLPDPHGMPKRVEVTIVYDNATEHHTIGGHADDGE